MGNKLLHKFLLTAVLLMAVGGVFADDVLPGFFSVSPTKKVHFASGNLQYNHTTPGYQLASTQYSMAGDANTTAIPNSTGVRDLFRWSELEGIVAAGYEVLTIDEWQYLFGANPSNCRDNAYDLFALARIEVGSGAYVNGVVILPDYDTWIMPAGLSLNYVETSESFEKNTYSLSQWRKMEAAGAVFLPSAGYMHYVDSKYKIEDDGVHGTYWTPNESTSGRAYRVQFDDGGGSYFSDFGDGDKLAYYSVRPVKTVATANILSEEDTQTDFETKKEALAGATVVDIYRTLRMVGSLNTLTLPFNVPDIEASPLAGAEVYEFVSAEVAAGTLHFDITRRTERNLVAGTPYLIQWPNTGAVLTLMCFTDITWDDDNSADNAGTGNVKLCGFYGKKHINDDKNGTGHLNLFLTGNNHLNWPSDGDDAEAMMYGFRAYFHITSGSGVSAPIYRGMPTSIRIVQQFNTPTDVENVPREQEPCTKRLRNGQLVIIRNGVEYTVNGQVIKR